MRKGITRKQAFIILLLFFALSIALRLPNLNRPVSKHHEFNTAVVLINITAWRQAGGGSVFNYTPVMNFQQPGDKLYDKGCYIDNKGNQIYLSYGPGLFIIPYAFYQLFHLPAEPIYLQLLNLLFNLAAVLLLFLLFEKLMPPGSDKRYLTIIAGCTLFMFSPGILWYFGNGYNNIDIMMPFAFATLILLLPMLQSHEAITTRRLTLLSLLLITLIYIDWFVFFICLTAGLIALLKIKKNKKYIALLVVIAAAAITGVGMVFFQFASYTGMAAVAQYWQLRFIDRSIDKGNSPSYPIMAIKMVFHLLTSYFPVLLLVAANFIVLRLKKIRIVLAAPEIFFLRLYTVCVLLYNLVFFNWSSVHEFSMIPFSILPAYLGARLFSFMAPRTVWFGACVFFILAIAQYYFINRPGNFSRDGTRYDINKSFGQQLQKVPGDYKIFVNTESNPMAEYYAGRNFTIASSYEAAKKYIAGTGITKAVWVDQHNLLVEKITVIR